MRGAIKHVVLIASGKGGVGKSTVATNLAVTWAHQGKAVGLLDADIYGPSVPTMVGGAARLETDGERIFPVEKFGVKLVSMGHLVEPDTAMIWRGPMLTKALRQLVDEVDWGSLDYLIFDLPPGTGDVQLSLAQQLQVSGGILVTTPQEVALADVRRAKAMFDKVGIRTLGLIENMSYFICDQCSARHEIFASGGGESAALQLGVPFLGRVPIDIAVRECGDAGQPAAVRFPESASARVFGQIAADVAASLEALAAGAQKSERRKAALRVVAE